MTKTKKMIYQILPEFWEQWGADVNEKTRVTLEDIAKLAKTWDVTINKLMDQVKKIL